MTLPFGIDTWVYVALPLEKALERLKERGISYVELSCEHLSDLKKREDFIARAKVLNEVLNSLEIKPIQVHAIYGDIDLRLASNNQSERDSAFNEMKNWIELCSLLGAEVLVVHTARINNAETNMSFIEMNEKLKYINIDVFSQLSHFAKDYGVKIAVENRLENMFGSRPRDLIEIVEGSDPDYIGICFDTGHANVNKLNLLEFIEITKNYLIASHIHDNDGWHDLHFPPLVGNINWPELFKEFSLVYKKPLIFEIAGYRDLNRCDNNVELTKIIMKELT